MVLPIRIVHAGKTLGNDEAFDALTVRGGLDKNVLRRRKFRLQNAFQLRAEFVEHRRKIFAAFDAGIGLVTLRDAQLRKNVAPRTVIGELGNNF